jgi:hypothetical protein
VSADTPAGADHLSAPTRAMLERPLEDRLRYVQSERWIPYPRSGAVMDKLEDMLNGPRVDRPPCMLIVGPSHNGKTRLLKRFTRKHRPSDDPNADNAHVPVLTIESPAGPSEAQLFSTILTRIAALKRTQLNPRDAETRVVGQLRGLRVRLLIIDEAHSAFSRLPAQHKYYLSVIKRLSNLLQLPVAMAGVKELLSVTQLDAQFSNRFKPLYLPRWIAGQEYDQLLQSFELLIPLPEPSHLVETNLSTKLLALSEGLIGELSQLLEQCAILALKEDRRCIDFGLVNTVLGRRLYVPPSERARPETGLD